MIVYDNVIETVWLSSLCVYWSSESSKKSVFLVGWFGQLDHSDNYQQYWKMTFVYGCSDRVYREFMET